MGKVIAKKNLTKKKKKKAAAHATPWEAQKSTPSLTTGAQWVFLRWLYVRWCSCEAPFFLGCCGLIGL